MKHYNKLVRDSLPAMLRVSGHQVVTHAIEGEELLAALRAKIDEEVAEYDAATDDEQAAAELADLIEIIVTLAERRGYDEAKLNELRAQKASQRGTFDRGLFLGPWSRSVAGASAETGLVSTGRSACECARRREVYWPWAGTF